MGGQSATSDVQLGHGLDAILWLHGAQAKFQALGVLATPELGVVLGAPSDRVGYRVDIMDETIVD